jgi:[acyl-carrier-protein] S-malonyltransferase
MRQIIALFPGQGSQSVGMGRELHAKSDLARHYFSVADEQLGISLSSLCFDGPIEKLTATAIAQPAILTVSVICFELFRQARLNSPAPSHQVIGAAGHSLGEYSALVAAGSLRFEDAVLLVHKRGTYMQEAVAAGEGAMAAVLGREVGEIEAALAQVSQGVVEIANINSPGQIVIAGSRAAVEQAVGILGGKVVMLPVSAPFHCALMKPAEENLAKDLSALSISAPAFPVYSNFSAEPMTEPQQIRDALRLQVCGRVRWVESMERAIKELAPEACYEFGQGEVLTGLMKRINKTLPRVNIGSLEQVGAYT